LRSAFRPTRCGRGSPSLFQRENGVKKPQAVIRVTSASSVNATVDSATFHQSNQFGHGVRFHFLHYVGTMDFDCLFDGAELAGNFNAPIGLRLLLGLLALKFSD